MAQRGSFTWRSADETAERERCHRFLRNVLGITDPDPQATAKLAAERHERELQAWVDSISTPDGMIQVREGKWDRAKHPRAGTAPNPGWWATTDGSAGGIGSTVDTSHATNSLSAGHGVRATLAVWHPPVGHHWAPHSIVFSGKIRPMLSDDAVAYAMGSYSGKLNPPHRNARYGGITHHEYNKLVNDELETFINGRRIKNMTASEMHEFTNLVSGGRGANGEINPKIAAFNEAVKAQVAKGTSVPSKIEDVIAAGRKYMKTSRFRALAVGAVASGLLGEAVAQEVKLLDVASRSGHYRNALQALENGDLNQAQNLLIDGNDSLYHEILTQVGAHAALNFKATVEGIFANARSRNYK